MTVEVKMPLVSFCLLSYNKAQYVAEAVRGALCQTYEPLEILIVDDCSTDGSQQIIEEVLKESRARGEKRNVTFICNKVNRGLVRNAEYVYSLAKGELLVQAGCDDVSEPERVARLAAAWVKDGRRALTVASGSVNIDLNGLTVGPGPRICCYGPHGAVMAWHRLVMTSFPAVLRSDGFDDEIFAFRARVLAHLTDTQFISDLFVPDQLVRYRIGCGVSAIHRREFRSGDVRCLRARGASHEQALIDLELMRSRMTVEKYEGLKRECEQRLALVRDRLTLATAPSLRARYRAFMKVKSPRLFSPLNLQYACYLLPQFLGDPLLGLYLWIRERMLVIRNRRLTTCAS